MGNLFCLYQVDQSTVAIKESFGKFEDVLEPGCHCVPWVFGKQIAGQLTLRLQQLDVKCETKTKVFFFSFVVCPFTCIYVYTYINTYVLKVLFITNMVLLLSGQCICECCCFSSVSCSG